MMEVSFVVDGPVIPKGRARTCMHNGKVHTVTPQRSRTFESRVRWLALEARNRFERDRRGKWPLHAKGSYRLTITVNEPSRQARDLDNILKSLADAMNGILYPDDRLVDEVHVIRHRNTDEQRTLITVGIR